MNLFDHFFSLAGMPVLCALCAVGLLVLWGQRRSHHSLLWQAASMLFLAGAFLHIMTAWMLWCAAWTAAQALALRYHGSIKFYIAVGSSVPVLFASWLVALWDWSSLLRWILGSMAMGAVLVHVMPQAWSHAARHRGDAWLRGAYFLCTVFVFLMPLVSSIIWRAEIGLCLALLLGVAMGVCAWLDNRSPQHQPQHQDAQTQLLNREGLNAVCGPFLAQQAITVVMLCEFKPPSSAPGVAPAALHAFARLLQSLVRGQGWVARTGAAEFVMLLQSTDMVQAQAVAARMHIALAQTAALRGYSASAGLAQVDALDTMDLAIHRADVALCQSKEEEGWQPPCTSTPASAA